LLVTYTAMLIIFVFAFCINFLLMQTFDALFPGPKT